jgi:hypothetical protein
VVVDGTFGPEGVFQKTAELTVSLCNRAGTTLWSPQLSPA